MKIIFWNIKRNNNFIPLLELCQHELPNILILCEAEKITIDILEKKLKAIALESLITQGIQKITLLYLPKKLKVSLIIYQ